jgi:Ni/Co efflux regulator RcnB
VRLERIHLPVQSGDGATGGADPNLRALPVGLPVFRTWRRENSKHNMPNAFAHFSPLRGLGLAVVIACFSLSTQAGKPGWVEEGKHGKADKHHARSSDEGRELRTSEMRPAADPQVSVNIQIGGYFREPQRVVVREYYEPRMRAGKCPPGLKKKHNGCMPPGQVRLWSRGHVLPPDVVYYPVPASVQVRLGTPPAGHKFVRVASDILLIAVGTSLVVDAIEDLGRL